MENTVKGIITDYEQLVKMRELPVLTQIEWKVFVQKVIEKHACLIYALINYCPEKNSEIFTAEELMVVLKVVMERLKRFGHKYLISE